MMIPVLVCVPAQSFIVDRHETIPGTEITDDYFPMPIGYLRGFETADISDYEMVEKELAAVGLTMRYRVQRVRAENGSLGCLVCFAVEADTYEQAEQLSGFVSFGRWTGAYYVPPTIPEGLTADDSFVPVKRIALADCDGNKELPPYKDGSFHLSLLPQGKLFTLVFLEEDPEFVYAIFHLAYDASAVAAARKCFAELQKE